MNMETPSIRRMVSYPIDAPEQKGSKASGTPKP
ncbi:hypothetical protein FHX11_002323 [Rhizobium sp. BK602]|nr:hypothetical protein [Rhizobium sp. BK602]